MNIAIVTHNFIKGDGQGRVNYEIAKGLAERGHEVHLYANRIEKELLDVKGIHFHFVPVFIKRPNLLKVIIFAIMASIKLKRNKHDIIHLNGFTALVKHHLNTSHFVHSAWLKVMGKVERKSILYPYYWLYAFLNSLFEKFIYKKARCIVAVSSKVKKELMDAGIPEEKIAVIHNGIDLKYWKRVDVNKNFLSSYGVKENEFVLLFAGDLKLERKGLRFLLHAIKELEGVRLIIAGDERRSIFKELIDELNIREKAIHAGFIKEMRKLYSAADCFVFPSLYDPFSLVVMEAGACGCPVIVSSREFVGAAERVKDGENGLIINNPYSPEEIREKILGLKENPSLRMKISWNAPSIARSTDEMVEDYLSLYQKLL